MLEHSADELVHVSPSPLFLVSLDEHGCFLPSTPKVRLPFPPPFPQRCHDSAAGTGALRFFLLKRGDSVPPPDGPLFFIPYTEKIRIPGAYGLILTPRWPPPGIQPLILLPPSFRPPPNTSPHESPTLRLHTAKSAFYSTAPHNFCRECFTPGAAAPTP